MIPQNRAPLGMFYYIPSFMIAYNSLLRYIHCVSQVLHSHLANHLHRGFGFSPRCTVACTNIEKIDQMVFEGKTKTRCGGKLQIANMHWPWGAGMFATSLGPDDACFVAGANWHKNSGLMCVWGQVCAVQKEFIEATKTLGWHQVWWILVVCIFCLLHDQYPHYSLFQTHLVVKKYLAVWVV